MAKKILKAVCDNCGTKTKLEELAPIKRLWERMDPGGQVPDGECPKCGALAYVPVDESWPQGEDLLTASEAIHRWLSRSDLGRRGTTMAGKLYRAIDTEKKKRNEIEDAVTKLEATFNGDSNDAEHDAAYELVTILKGEK